MDQKIIETAHKYRQMAFALEDVDAGELLDTNIEEEAQSALLALYYAKALEARIEKCGDLLTEDTGEDAIDALWEASQAVDEAAKNAMVQIEQYANQDRVFEEQLDKVSVSMETDSVYLGLLKLYKCENIMAAAYRYASAHSYSSAPEEFIARHMDIDIEALLDIRKKLLDEIGKALGVTPQAFTG